ncbi:hypothetical protein BN1708_019548, partial [Verticillium longisporum]
ADSSASHPPARPCPTSTLR